MRPRRDSEGRVLRKKAPQNRVHRVVEVALRKLWDALGSLSDWRQNKVRGLSLERDFGRLQGRELDRALADIGLTRNDLSSLLKGCPIARQMFPRMMERIGVDTERAWRDPKFMGRIELACRACSVRRHCQRWLRSDEPAAGYRAFCPNASEFDRLLRGAPEHES
ncbi:MAG: DUF6455 family protein [Alphaproteobacteria bacterium]